MKRFNKTLLAIALTLTASEAFAADALVVDTTPLMGSVIKVQNVPETRMECNGGSNDGLIEKGVGGLFGSTEGLLGTAIGYGIGDQIGGGSGNEIAKVLGAVIGNKVGNNVGTNNQQCREVTHMVRQTYRSSEVTSYRVTVELGDQRYNVDRQYEPAIGSYIPVSLTVR
jgi:uncharacterized protein YcfJ|tara:strand:- start:2169 stop:2675 length:507 start_codon:yes stop_codon:yes gene_type:complete